jgi:uncharacterized protein
MYVFAGEVMMAPKNERFEMRLDEDLLVRVDEWRRVQSDFPSRAEAMRRLIELGLTKNVDSESVRFSDGEKLLLLMMADLYKHLKLGESGIDTDFISEVIWGGHYWAPKWELSGVFHGHEDDPKNLRLVLDVLDMWDQLERAYEKLSENDQALLEKNATPLGKDVKFRGFDGNNEAEHLSITKFLIEKMDRFSRFNGRDLNAHMPTLDIHRRMLNVFTQMRNDRRMGGELNVAQITALLKARPHPESSIAKAMAAADEAGET